MEDGIEHAVGPLKLAVGAGLDVLDDGVAVAFAFGEQSEDERFGGGGDECLTNHRGTIHRGSMYVKRGFVERTTMCVEEKEVKNLKCGRQDSGWRKRMSKSAPSLRRGLQTRGSFSSSAI